MYFVNQMFNPAFVNPNSYNQMQAQIIRYNVQQNIEVENAVHAMHDLCKAVKNMDESHQKTASFACLAVMAQEFGW